MPVFRLRWSTVFVAGVVFCASASVRAQTAQPAEPPADAAPEVRRLLDNRDRGFRSLDRERGLSESVRRFGREHQDAQILSVEPILIQGRNLNRIKALDASGRVRIWVDDPQAPRTPPPHGKDNGKDNGDRE